MATARRAAKERIYADTSVFGGAFEPEYLYASRRFFDLAVAGVFNLVVSVLVQEELRNAPQRVVLLWEELEPLASVLAISAECELLKDGYLEAGILPASSARDALHVALATAGACTRIVSWNFRHIVNFRRIPLFNAVNVLQGYNPIEISTPHEVIGNED